jgi:hypothetical protein
MSSQSSAPHHVERQDHDLRDAILVSGVKHETGHDLDPYLSTTMTAHSTFQLGTYHLVGKNQPGARPCALARIPFTREDVRRSDAWMSRRKSGAGCGGGRSSA